MRTLHRIAREMGLSLGTMVRAAVWYFIRLSPRKRDGILSQYYEERSRFLGSESEILRDETVLLFRGKGRKMKKGHFD